jgi:hypothetical protein
MTPVVNLLLRHRRLVAWGSQHESLKAEKEKAHAGGHEEGNEGDRAVELAAKVRVNHPTGCLETIIEVQAAPCVPHHDAAKLACWKINSSCPTCHIVGVLGVSLAPEH